MRNAQEVSVFADPYKRKTGEQLEIRNFRHLGISTELRGVLHSTRSAVHIDKLQQNRVSAEI